MAMGMFQVRVKVSNSADPGRSFEEEFWVDTGALYSFVPEDRLVAIALAHHEERQLIHADGRTDRRRIGSAIFQVEGLSERMPCPAIFAPPGSPYLLGDQARPNGRSWRRTPSLADPTTGSLYWTQGDSPLVTNT
jgi:hypothetical protein